MITDPYKILGLDRSASQSEIKRAYRRQAKALHPDQHPDDASKADAFKRLSAAYAILSDETKRGQYDRGEIDANGEPVGFAHAGHPGAGFGQRRYTQSRSASPFEDIFSRFYEGQAGPDPRQAYRQRTGPVKGQDLRFALDIDLADAVLGAKRRLTLQGRSPLTVTIPPGVTSGQTLRLKSQGAASPFGGPPGDALIEITVRADKVWQREGNDLHMSVPIDLETAVLGGKIPVQAPDGRVQLKIPAGSNTGDILRLKGKGVRHKISPGHLFVRLEIVLKSPHDPALSEFLRGRKN